MQGLPDPSNLGGSMPPPPPSYGQLALSIKLLGQAKQSWHWNVSGQLHLPSTTSGSLSSEHAVRQLTLPHLLLGSLPCGKPYSKTFMLVIVLFDVIHYQYFYIYLYFVVVIVLFCLAALPCQSRCRPRCWQLARRSKLLCNLPY